MHIIQLSMVIMLALRTSEMVSEPIAPFSAEFKNTWWLTSTVPYDFITWRLNKNGNKFYQVVLSLNAA